MYATILPIIFGALLILGAVLNLDYFLQFRGVRLIEALLGRTVQRLVVASLGVCVVVSPWVM